MLVYLLFQYIAVQGTLLGLVIKFIGDVHFVEGYPMVEMQYCRPFQGRNTLIGTAFALLLGSITVVMGIMVFLAHQKHRGLRSELVSVFYRDGISYFICLSVMTSVNVFVNFAAPKEFQFLFLELEIALHGILSTRMILHLRRTEARVSGVYTFSNGFRRPASPIVFEPHVQPTQPSITGRSRWSRSRYTSYSQFKTTPITATRNTLGCLVQSGKTVHRAFHSSSYFSSRRRTKPP